MTTIAYRDGVIASDSKVSTEHYNEGSIDKIFIYTVEENLSFLDRVVFRKEPSTIDYLVGYCGGVGDALDYIDVIFGIAPQEKGNYDCEVLTVRQLEDGDYEVKIYDGTSLRGISIKNDYVSIGSGARIAMGALFQGASAEEAVRAAIYHDNMSGGDIQVRTFGDE